MYMHMYSRLSSIRIQKEYKALTDSRIYLQERRITSVSMFLSTSLNLRE